MLSWTLAALMELLLDPVWNWPISVAISVGLIAVVAVTYPARVRHLPAGPRRVLIGLRLLSALVLAFAMFRPLSSTRKRMNGEPGW